MLSPPCKLLKALDIGFLDPPALLIPESVYLKTKIQGGLHGTCSQSAISALIFPMSLTRSLTTATAWLGWRELCRAVSGCAHGS